MQIFIEQLINIIKEKRIKKITILGHDHIDEDSCISALLLQHILKVYHIDSQIKIMDTVINEHTLRILMKLGHDMKDYQVKETDENDHLFLVDHYRSTHKGMVIGCIDHHPTNQQFDYLIYENDKSSACCKKIYNYMEEAHMPIDRKIIQHVVYGLMIDTFAFKSSRGTLKDKKWVEEMVETYDLDYKGMYADALSLTDLGKTIEEIALTNLKVYDFEGAIVKSTYIQVDKEPHNIEEILQILQQNTVKEKLALWVFLLVDVEKIKTVEYRIYPKQIEKISHDKLTSRAQGIMPKIEQLFER
ncbi:MAG: DHH family phosphoesterase [Cellulosilyticaceae bacterium]